VEEAKYALRAVQAERPPSRQLLRRLEMEQESQDGHRQSTHIVRPPSATGSRIHNLRRPSSSMHLRYGSTFELAPVVQAEKFKPTHLRRQRSDLTDFRNRADSTLEELRRRDYGKLNLQRTERDLTGWRCRIPRIRRVARDACQSGLCEKVEDLQIDRRFAPSNRSASEGEPEDG
jgi:hypothetical protein